MKYDLPLQLPDFLTTDELGWVRITGRRISLCDIVEEFNAGKTAEEIAARFPTISLAQAHHVIAFYLDHQSPIDKYVKSAHDEADRHRLATPPSPKMLELRARARDLHEARLKAAHAS